MLTRQNKMSVIKETAKILIELGAKHRIEEGYTRINPFQIAHAANVIVMLRPLDKLLGAFVRQDQPGILINSERPAGLVLMTCAHELGHFFLGHNSTADEKLYYTESANQKELEADLFAYNLLAPRWAISNIMRKKNWLLEDLKNPFALYQLALRLGISYQATAWSMNRYNLFDDRTVNALLKQTPSDIKKALLGRTPEPAHKDVWLLDEADQYLILEPRIDDYVIIRLKNHTNTGYVWNVEETASEGFSVEPLLINSESPNSQSNTFVAGGIHKQDYLVSPKTVSGVSPLLLSERAAWNQTSPAIDNYETKTCYEHLACGLSTLAKNALLQGQEK